MYGVPHGEQEICPKDPELSSPSGTSTLSWKEMHQVPPTYDSLESLSLSYITESKTQSAKSEMYFILYIGKEEKTRCHYTVL